MSFHLDPRIEEDSLPVADLALSAVRLMRDANYPWLLLVPRRPDLVEILDLAADDRLRLMQEIAAAAAALTAEVAYDKLNIATLGNQVRQLHVHVIARRIGDAAWPRPIWGAAQPIAYEAGAAERLVSGLRARLAAPAPGPA